MSFILRYSRYRVPGEMSFDTLEEALDSAAADIEFCEAYPIEILEKNSGTVIADIDQINDHWKKKFH